MVTMVVMTVWIRLVQCSDCLLGQPRTIFEISASEAGSKVEKSGGDVDGEGECGDAVADDEVRDR